MNDTADILHGKMLIADGLETMVMLLERMLRGTTEDGKMNTRPMAGKKCYHRSLTYPDEAAQPGIYTR